MVYLGIDGASRSFLMGSLYDLFTTVAVEVTVVEDEFPFRQRVTDDAASHWWNDRKAPMEPAIEEPVDLDPMPWEGITAPPVASKERPTMDALKELEPLQPRAEDVQEEHDHLSSDVSEDDAKLDEPVPQLRRSARQTKAVPRNTNKYKVAGAPDAILACTATDLETVLQCITEADLVQHTPSNAYQALSSPLRDKWIKAMNREKRCHVKNNTFGDCQWQCCQACSY